MKIIIVSLAMLISACASLVPKDAEQFGRDREEFEQRFGFCWDRGVYVQCRTVRIEENR